MTVLGLALTSLFALTVLLAPRRWASLGLAASICYITQGQSIEIAPLHFYAVRLVLLAGLARIIVRGELKRLNRTAIDGALLLFTLTLAIVYILRRRDLGALIYQSGCCYDILLSYFVFRCLIADTRDVMAFLPRLALLIAPLAAAMIVESMAGSNIFSALGAVPETGEIRYEHLRCQGPFRSAITAGTFGATLVPLFVGLMVAGGSRRCATLGLLGAAAITATAHASGPLLAFVSGVGALALWRWRDHLNRIRWGAIAALVCLHIIMKAPVWFLIARVGDLVGGGGWHRAELISQGLAHFGSWWLLGTDDTGGWMPTQLLAFGRADVTNEYLAAGVNGGLLAMLLLIRILVKSAQHLGAAMREARRAFPPAEKLLWGLGCALFAHSVNFLSVSYFDQVQIAWWLLLALISATTAQFCSAPSSVSNEARVPDQSEELAVPAS